MSLSRYLYKKFCQFLWFNKAHLRKNRGRARISWSSVGSGMYLVWYDVSGYFGKRYGASLQIRFYHQCHWKVLPWVLNMTTINPSWISLHTNDNLTKAWISHLRRCQSCGRLSDLFWSKVTLVLLLTNAQRARARWAALPGSYDVLLRLSLCRGWGWGQGRFSKLLPPPKPRSVVICKIVSW